jgi:RNA polymerase sigma factor (sigma-70 family)
MARNRRAGDVEAEAELFSALFRQHYAQIVAFARRRVGPDACQEIAAETFLVAWRRFGSMPDVPLPWLFQVATFTIANYRRREARTVAYGASASLDQLAAPIRPHDEPSVDAAITQAFDSLNPKDQEILRLAAWDGLSSSEGASVLGCTVAAYKVRLHRARTRLAKRLSAIQPESRAADRPDGAEDPSPFRAAEETA